MSKSNVPEIRFEGFSGEWNNEKLELLADFSKGQGYSKKDLTKKGTPIILYGRLYTKYQTIISKVDTFVCAENGSTYSKGNEVIVPASGETSEDIARASAVSVEGIILGGDLNIIYPKDRVSNVFLALTISNGRTQKALSQKAQGKSVVHLRNSDLKEIDLFYPQEDEQTKIGNYFQNLDKLISQKEKKQKTLKQLKKAMLGKMFPKSGKTKPEIRFEGFCGEWEEKAMFQMVNICSGKDYKHLSLGNIPVYGTGGYMLSVNEALSYEDAIGIGRKGTIDKPYILQAPFWTVDTLFFAIPSKENYLAFVYCIFQKINWRQKDESTGVPSLSKVVINNIQVFSSNYDEQTKIGNYFQKLDKLIELQEKELEKLKNLKKASLEKMFVS